MRSAYAVEGPLARLRQCRPREALLSLPLTVIRDASDRFNFLLYICIISYCIGKMGHIS